MLLMKPPDCGLTRWMPTQIRQHQQDRGAAHEPAHVDSRLYFKLLHTEHQAALKRQQAIGMEALLLFRQAVVDLIVVQAWGDLMRLDVQPSLESVLIFFVNHPEAMMSFAFRTQLHNTHPHAHALCLPLSHTHNLSCLPLSLSHTHTQPVLPTRCR